MVVHCPDLNFLEAKKRKQIKFKWTPEQDQMLKDFACVDPMMLREMLKVYNLRLIMKRQRDLGVRQFTCGKRKDKR